MTDSSGRDSPSIPSEGVDSSSRAWVAQRPEPGRFWVTHRPRSWASSDSWWTNVAEGILVPPGPPRLQPSPPWCGERSALVYLPPSSRPAELGAIVEDLRKQDVEVLVQLYAGEQAPAKVGSCLFDLLPILLQGEIDLFLEIPPRTAAVWPLIAGVTDDPGLWQRGCETLAEAGVACVQGMVPTLSALDRRRLAEQLTQAGDQAFGGLFHGEPPRERDFARVVHGLGLETAFRRPGTGNDSRSARNRRVAELLSLAAETWSSVGRSEVQGQALFQAARWAEDTSVDVQALAIENNLAILEWLRPPAVGIVEEWARSGDSATLHDLRAEYLSSAEEGGPRR